MSKVMEKALDASIQHWERMATGKRRKMKDEYGDLRIEEPYQEHCALCRACTRDDQVDCRLCPVMGKTKYEGCFETPYLDAENAFTSLGPDSDDFKAAASEMVNFLRELRT